MLQLTHDELNLLDFVQRLALHGVGALTRSEAIGELVKRGMTPARAEAAIDMVAERGNGTKPGSRAGGGDQTLVWSPSPSSGTCWGRPH